MSDKITAHLPYIEEDILVEPGILRSSRLHDFVVEYDQVIIFADKHLEVVQPWLLQVLKAQLAPQHVALLNVDENLKSVGQYNALVELLIEYGITRKSCLVAVGGGHVGDLIGYLAATYMRGIEFIQVPTTLMSMADAIIGKVAIDFGAHKNLLGAFASPRYVLCDPSLLESLPQSQRAEGLVEVWKHTLLVGSLEERGRIDNLLDSELKGDYTDLVRFSLEIKRRFVEADYSDTKGAHAALSLGHTLSNVLEKNIGISHGAGVLTGILHAAILARELDKIDEKYFNYILAVGREFSRYLPQVAQAQAWIEPQVVTKLLQFDKINRKGTTRLIVMTSTGYEMVSLLREQLSSSFDSLKVLEL